MCPILKGVRRSLETSYVLEPSPRLTVFVIVGLVVVFGSILFGYTMHHGHVGVLMQWSEFIIIGGAAVGAFLISNPMSVVKAASGRVLGLLKPNPYNEKAYAELLKVLYDVFQKARKDGLVGLEAHIEDPEEERHLQEVSDSSRITTTRCPSSATR